MRLKELRKERGITAKFLADKLNISESTISCYESGRRHPDYNTMKRIAEYFGVTLDYLLGSPEKDRSSPAVPSPSPASAPVANIFLLKTKKVPLLGEIACGEPIFADEHHGEFVTVSEDFDVDFCLRAKGDSMKGARIYDGDVVFIHRQESVQNGEIAAVIIDDEATLKRVYFYPEKHKLVLNPENPAFEPLVFVGAELESIHILGKAIAFQSVIR